jgi:3-hydroxy-9,10-secoandrosta-1,3,5(10)-triene-9,17-dione monooxygenase reductase component
MNDSPTALDAGQFRNAMGLFATGVAVIAAPAGEEIIAMTANAVSSVSLDPMLILFCPSKKSRFAQNIQGVGGFTVNFLRHDQQALSTYFAGGWKELIPPPFRFIPATCAPRLEGSLASLHCEREQLVQAGDHWIVIGRVRHLHVGIPPHKPLVFFGGRYRHIALADSTPAPYLGDVHEEPAHIFYEG